MYLDDWENQSTTEETGKPEKGGGEMNISFQVLRIFDSSKCKVVFKEKKVMTFDFNR